MSYDLFISYSRRDNEQSRITQFLERLRADFDACAGRPLLAFFDVSEISGMDDWRHRILRGLRESRLFLACLSPSYLASHYCEWEVNEYLNHEVGRFAAREGVAPIYFVDVPGWNNKDFDRTCYPWVAELRRRQHFDFRQWFGVGEEALRDPTVLAQLLSLSSKLTERIRLGERSEHSPGNVDAHNPHFIGRLTELRRLRETVALGRVGVLTAVHGLGGVGKTALAVEYAHAFASEYGGGRWQVRCEGKDDMRAAVAQLVAPLRIDARSGDEKDIGHRFESVISELRHRAEARAPHRCLLILDNVDQPRLLEPAQTQRLPAAEWLHIIATTRLSENELSGGHRDRAFLPVDELPEADALELIESYQPEARFSSDVEREAAREIVRLLGGFTLAVESAGVYLGEFANEVTCAGLLTRLMKEGLGSLDAIAGESSSGVRHGERRLSATLQPTWERLEGPERLILSYAALLPADRVPLLWIRALVSQRFPDIGKDAAPGHLDIWAQLLRRLFGLRLLQPTGRQAEAKMHRAIQVNIRRSMPDGILKKRRESLIEYIRTVRDDLEINIERSDARHSSFLLISAGQADLKNELQFVENLMGQHPRWHPARAQQVKVLGPREDYSEVWAFPCCGLKVLTGDGAPAQFRADGCEQAP